MSLIRLIQRWEDGLITDAEFEAEAKMTIEQAYELVPAEDCW